MRGPEQMTSRHVPKQLSHTARLVLTFGLQDSPYLVMAEAAGGAFFDQDDLGPPR